MELINNKTLRPEEVPADQVGDKFLSGSHGFRRGDPVFLKDTNGKIDQYIPEDVHTAVTKAGYDFPTSNEIYQYKMEQKYGNHPATAAALGAADTALFGGASQLLSKTGLASQEALEQIPEQNKAMHAVGSGVGLVAGLALSPEAQMVEKARDLYRGAQAVGDLAKAAEYKDLYLKAKKSWTMMDALNPVSAASKLGHATSELVAAAPEAASLGQKVLNAGIKGALGAGAETAAYSLGEINREEAIGDPTLTPGKIASQIGFSALMGGTLGGFFGAGGELASTLKSRMAPSFSAALEKGTSAIEKHEDILNFIPGGRMLSEGAKTLMDPLGSIKHYGEIEHKLVGTSVLYKIHDMVEKAGKELISKADMAVEPAMSLGSKAISSAMSKDDKVEKAQKEIEDYKEKTTELRHMSLNYEKMIDSLDGATKNLTPFAPQTGQEIQNTIASGISFLNSKIPQKQTDDFSTQEYVPSKPEMSKFMTYYNTVQKPLSALESLRTNSISPEQIETLKTVYPPLYQDMKTHVALAAFKDPKKLSYQKKLSLSMFLGQNVDNSLSPEMVRANQMSFMAVKNGMSKQKDAIAPTSKGLGNLNIASRSLTPLEKSAQREKDRETT